MTALIAQETETFHPFTTDEWRIFFGFVCHQHSYLHIHSDSPPGLQLVLRSVVPPTKSSTLPAEEDREEEEEEEKWSPGSWYITAMSEQRERGEMRQRGGKNVGRVREERERNGGIDL